MVFIGAGEKYGLRVGDHAISENIVPCWECRYCKRGDYHMCMIFHEWCTVYTMCALCVVFFAYRYTS